jgi:RNA polymerase sigma-70 factor (ECF subfamily)
MPDSPGKQFRGQIEPYLGPLYRAACRLTGNTADAQDLVQDTCVRAWSRLTQLAAADSPLGWLMRVQYNLFIDGSRLRQRQGIRPLDDADLDALRAEESTEPERSLADRQGLATVERAWSRLTREQRGLLALLVEGYRLSEIQEITGLGLNVINARLHRARRSLARHLQCDAEQEERAATERLR